MIHDHMPRWFSGIIRPSGFLTQEYTLLEYGRGPAFDSRLGPFCCRHPWFRAVFGLEMIDESIRRRCRYFKGSLDLRANTHVRTGGFEK